MNDVLKLNRAVCAIDSLVSGKVGTSTKLGVPVDDKLRELRLTFRFPAHSNGYLPFVHVFVLFIAFIFAKIFPNVRNFFSGLFNFKLDFRSPINILRLNSKKLDFQI